MRSIGFAHTRGIYCGASVAVTPPPQAPSGLAVTVSGSTARITYVDNTGGAGDTVIERSSNPSSGFVQVASKTPGVVEHYDSGLANGTYYWRAYSVVNGVSSLTMSNVVSGSINVISGGAPNLAVGDTITINGTGFGEGVTGVFEDFELGAIGASLSTLGLSVASSNGCPIPIVSSERVYAGTRCGFADCDNSGDSLAYLQNLDTEEIYISAHTFAHRTWGAPRTVKGFRIDGNIRVNVYTAYPGFMVQEPARFDAAGPRLQVNRSNTAADYSVYYGFTNIGDEQWHREQYHYKFGTPGEPNGFAFAWVDGVLCINRPNEITRAAGVTTRIQRALLPFYWGGNLPGQPVSGGGQWFYDNLVVRTGPNCAARVELGDSASFASCTKREELENISWADTAVDAKLHPHTFGTGQAWLHVINAQGVPVFSQEVNLT